MTKHLRFMAVQDRAGRPEVAPQAVRGELQEQLGEVGAVGPGKDGDGHDRWSNPQGAAAKAARKTQKVVAWSGWSSHKERARARMREAWVDAKEMVMEVGCGCRLETLEAAERKCFEEYAACVDAITAELESKGSDLALMILCA